MNNEFLQEFDFYNKILIHMEKNDEEILELFKYYNKDSDSKEYQIHFFNHFFKFLELADYILRFNNKTKDDIFSNLLIYIKFYYNNYDCIKNITDLDSLKDKIRDYYKLLCTIRVENCFKSTNEYDDILCDIYEFSCILTDYFIRVINFSIIGISNQKYIVTSCNNCHKKFIDYLLKGYSLFRIQKVIITNIQQKNHCTFIPLFPTRDVQIPIIEYMEVDVNNNNSIDNKKMVKIL